ncbi:MAG: hypothetical protein DMG39_05025 [Acidobacteria bacterium]|nr:MAG: hypothetical protein DMG39_05025 [Acidobacteriota bacterium]
MLANLALAVKRRSIHQGVRLDEHFPNVLQSFSLGASNAVQVVNVDEVREHVGDVSGDGRFLQAYIREEVPPDQFAEEFPQASFATRAQWSGHHNGTSERSLIKNSMGGPSHGQSGVWWSPDTGKPGADLAFATSCNFLTLD